MIDITYSTERETELLVENEKLRRQVIGSYNERNRLVALLAKFYPSVLCKTEIKGWDAAWHNCVYIEFPWGQASWHFHDSEAKLFAHVKTGDAKWDGHDTAQKYAAINSFVMDTQ